METQPTQHPPWPFSQKFRFRFFVLFFGLNLFPFPASMTADMDRTDSLPYQIWGKPVQWLATHFSES